MRGIFALSVASLAALLGCAGAAGSSDPIDGLIPFVWPRAGQVTLMTCRFETALPIGVTLENATPEDETAVDAALRGWESAGLGVRFMRTTAEHAQIAIAFRGEPLAAAGRTVVDCKLRGERAEIARARIDVTRSAVGARGETQPLARSELLGVLARELAHALGWLGETRPGDPARDGSLADARRAGDSLLAGGPLVSPALRALYALPSGAPLARAPAEPAAATRLVDRLANLAAAHDLDGPYLRTGSQAGRVFWRERASADEYGVQLIDLARQRRAPGRVVVALEARARRALPRSRDATPD